MRFVVLIGAAEGRLTLPRSLLNRLLASLDPAATAAEGETLCLLLELVFEAALVRFEARFPHHMLQLRPAPDTPWEARAALGLACRFGDPQEQYIARLDFGQEAAHVIGTVLNALPTQRRTLPRLAIPLRIRALATDLPLAELRGTGPGDVILAEPPGPGEMLLVAAEHLGWRARRDGRVLRLTTSRLALRAAGLEEWTMRDAPEDSPPDAALDELPVRLVFEVGRLEVPLGELEALGPGYVFELGRDDGVLVDIVANGRRLGRGEVVTVGGALGVRVLWMGREGAS